jgi:hypothetical protein
VTMALRATESADAYSQVEIDGDGHIRRMRLLVDRARSRFAEYSATLGPEILAELRPLMYCGTMVCEPALLDLMPSAPPFSLISDVLAPVVAKGLPVFGHVHSGFFRTLDDLLAYEDLRAEFALSPLPLPYLCDRPEVTD